MKKLRLKRVALWIGAFALLVSLAVFVRIRTALPYLDEVRLRHWYYKDEWNALADLLWQQDAIEFVATVYDDGELKFEVFPSTRIVESRPSPNIPGATTVTFEDISLQS